MGILNIIEKKKNKQQLTKQEIQYFVDSVCNGTIKDYQTTSFLMAVCLNGLSFEETYNLTISMANSGKKIDLSDVGLCFDKHSTGGVSDTTTLVIVPILASLGIKVAKMSGRSLGWTGGTADKMEVFEGYRNDISVDDFKKLIKQNGASIISQQDDLVVADKIIYKLRSESGTVDNISLIASSIMSKKIACGAKFLILDCKFGNGAFMKTKADCKKLAKTMIKIGNRAGLKVVAIVSDMNQPLTNYIGNNVEVYSSIRVLKGETNDLSKLATKIAEIVILEQGLVKDRLTAQKMIENSITSGMAIEKLKQIVTSQGGKTDVIEDENLLLPKNDCQKVYATTSGFVEGINTAKLGDLQHKLQQKNNVFERQDNVSIILNKRIGDAVKNGEVIAEIYHNSFEQIDEIATNVLACFKIGGKRRKIKLIEEIIK